MKKMTTRVSPLNQKKKVNREEDVSYKSDMIGMPGTEFRKKVDKQLKEYESRNKTTTKPMAKKQTPKPTPKSAMKPSAPTKQMKSTKTTSASSKSAIKMKKC
jgi:hypothetical protein